MLLGLVALLAAAAAILPAHALDPRAKVLVAAQGVIAPRYDALDRAAARQSEAWRRFCTAPDPQGFERVRSAYRQTADAWSGIEFVRYGPILTENRIERMAHWPERGNAVSRALGPLLSRSGTDDLAPERFARMSVAGQGLTALERLLFDGGADEARSAILSRTPAATRRCAVGQAIAAGLERIAERVRDEWSRSGNGVLARLGQADAATVQEAAARLATELLSFIEFVADRKLAAPLGPDPASARPTLAEGWRSGRSLDAIRINLEGIEALTRALVDPASEEGRSALFTLESARSLATSIEGEMSTLADDPRQRSRLFVLRDMLRGARELAGAALTESLGVTIGFNSRDGD